MLSLKNVDVKDFDEMLYLYMKDHIKKFNHCLIGGEIKLDFNNTQDSKYVRTGMIDNKTFFSWSNYLREANNILKEEGYYFNHIAGMDSKTLAHKRDMTFDFYLKQNISAFEWKLNAMINADKYLIIKFPQNCWYPINTKFEFYRKDNI